MKKVLVIVEGDGEVKAAPHLVRRVLTEVCGHFDRQIETHRRKGIDHLRANDWANLKRYLAAAYLENMPVLWMLDCDDDCAVKVVNELHAQAKALGIQQPLAFCLWVREYETMFLYDHQNVALKLGIPEFAAPQVPEDRRGAKELLSAAMPRGRAYKERIDQLPLTAVVDLNRLRNSYRSYRHFENAIKWLVDQTGPSLYPLRGDG